MITALKNHIVFQFEEELDRGHFDRSTSWGLKVVASVDESAKESRWGVVVAAGPECSPEISTPGTAIFIDALRWTPGVTHNGQTYWKTDETQVIGYRVE